MTKMILAIATAMFGCSAAFADVWIFNTTDLPMKYRAVLPDGRVKEGLVEACGGEFPAQTTVHSEGSKPVRLKVFGPSSAFEVEAPSGRMYLIGKKQGNPFLKPISWSLMNSQGQKPLLGFYNATEARVTFNLVDEKQERRLSLQPGQEVVVEGKHGFGSTNDIFSAKFGGKRKDRSFSLGYVILFTRKREPDQVFVSTYGYIR